MTPDQFNELMKVLHEIAGDASFCAVLLFVLIIQSCAG